MTLSITPQSTSNLLKIETVFNCSQNLGSPNITVALFQDSTADALAAVGENISTNTTTPVSFTHIMTAGTTSSTTFKIRAGLVGAATLTFNGNNGTRLYGGVLASSIVITEFKA
jgi:hypothetical protein